MQVNCNIKPILLLLSSDINAAQSRSIFSSLESHCKIRITFLTKDKITLTYDPLENSVIVYPQHVCSTEKVKYYTDACKLNFTFLHIIEIIQDIKKNKMLPYS